MSKTKKILLIVFSALFALSLAVFGIMQVNSALADSDVLEGNTATYDFINDKDNPWIYERDTNTWYNTTNNTTARKLTLNITSPGNVKFKYLANLNNTNKQGSPQYGFNCSDFYITLNKGEYHNNIVMMHGEKMNDYKELSVEGLQAGDSIIFTYELTSSNVESDKVLITGLNSLPVEDKSVQLAVKTGGQVDYNGLKDSVNENIANGSLIKFKAVANEGYDFAFWQNENGEVVSVSAEMSVLLINDINYTAYFRQQGNDGEVFADEKWQLEGSTYKLNTAEVPKDEVHRLKYAFKGTKNVECSYDYRSNDYDALDIYLDGNSFDTIYDWDDKGVVDTEIFQVSGDGYHVLEFVYLNDVNNSPTNKLELSNLKNSTPEMAKEGLTAMIRYNPKLGKVYINGVYVTPDVGFTVPKDVAVSFVAEEFSEVDSTIQPGEKTTVRWAGYYAHDEANVIKPRKEEDRAQIWPDRTTSSIKFNSDGTTTCSSSFKMTGYEIDVRFLEVALAPEVSVITQSGSDISKEIPVKNNDVINLVYEKENNVQLLFKAYEGLEPKYNIKINNVLVDNPNFVTEAGKTVYSISNVNSDKAVTVSYSLEGYFDSPEITVNFKIKSEYSIEDKLVLNKDKITMYNDQYYPWEFSGEHTSDIGYAFMPVNTGVQGFYGKTVSSLKFDLKDIGESGIFVFDFMLHAGSNILTYSFDKPLTIKDSIASMESGNSYIKDNNKEDVYFINGDEQSYKYILGRGSDTDKEISNNQKFYWFTEPYIGDKTITLQDDNWVHVSIPVSSENSQIYINYFKSSDHYGNAVPYNDSNDPDYVLLRNIGCFSGEGKITYSASNPSAGQISVTEFGNDKSITSGDKMPLGSRVTFNATVNPDSRFYAWVDTDTNEVLSFDKTFTATVVKNNFNIKAVIDNQNKYVARIKGVFYEDFEQALLNAQNQSVIIISDFTIKNSLTINSDTTVIMPVNDRGDWYELGTNANSSTRVSWADVNSENGYLLKTLTISADATLTIRGKFYLGAVLNHPDQYAQGLTSGKYNKLDINGNVVVENGGTLDIMGLVTGNGGITVNNGGTLYQPFMILDYNGGTNTEAMFGEHVTPFKMYAMVNIQCAQGYKINFGGVLMGHASLYFWGGTTTIETPFITYKGARDELETALIILEKKGSYVQSIYDDKHARPNMSEGNNAQDVGSTNMTIYGDATAGYMQFPLEINTSGVYFSLPYNYNLTLKGGSDDSVNTFTLANNYKLMPGSTLTVEKNATLKVVSGKGLYVYDSFYGPNVAKRVYPTGEQLKTAGYKPYASLIVNGTLDLQNNSHFVGTVQNGGTGHIKVGTGVTLEEELFDGTSTVYSCNYTKYTLKAQVCDAAHENKLVALEAGHTYTADSEVATFDLPGIEFEYETVTKHTGAEHTLEKLTTEKVEGLAGGSWKLDHALNTECQCEWDYAPQELPTAEEKVKTFTRQCTVVGCTNKLTRTLLYTDTEINLGDITYKASATAADDIKGLLNAYYGEVTQYIKDVQFGDDQTEHGTYSVTVTLQGGALFRLTDEDSTSFTFKYNIVAATLTGVELKLSSKQYDGNIYTPEQLKSDVIQSVTAGETAIDSADYDVAIAAKEGTTSPNAGQYTVTVTGKNNATGTATADFTITPIEITVTVKDGTATYAGKNNAPAIPAALYEISGDFVGADSITVTVGYQNPSPDAWSTKETYTLVSSYVFSGSSESNYTVTHSDTGTLTVTPAAVNLSVQAKNTDYNADGNYDTSWKLTGMEGFFGDFDEQAVLARLTVTCDVNENNTVGPHDITLAWNDGGEFDNFTVQLSNSTYTISPIGYGDVKWSEDNTFEYDGSAHGLALEGLPDDDSITVTITYKLKTEGDEAYKEQEPTDAGEYDVKAVLSSDNYQELNVQNGTLTISKAEVDTVEISGTYTYNGGEQSLQVTVTANGQNVPAGEYSVECANLKNAQNDITYTVTVKAESKNFQGSGSTTFTILKAPLTIKVKNQSKVYNNTDATVSSTAADYEFEGAVYDELGISLTLQSTGKDATKYKINYATTQAAANNYDITWKNEDGAEITGEKYPYFEITPKAVSVTIGNLTSVYGDEVKTNYDFSPKSFLNDGYTVQLENFTCAASKTSDANSYPISATVKNPNPNYTITVNNGNYEITERPITVTIANKTTVYGQTLLALTYEITSGNTVNGDGDAPNFITLTKAGNDDADEYKITGVCSNDNYDVTFIDGTYTITKKPINANMIMVIIKSGEDVFSDDDNDGVINAVFAGVALTAEAEALEGEVKIPVKCSITTIPGAGTYQLTATVDHKNYSGEVTLTVEVTLSIDEMLKLFGEIAGGLTPQNLTADDFQTVKQIAEQLSTLTEEQRADERLAAYEQLVSSWQSSAQVEQNVVTSAAKIADAPIAAVVGTVSALLALAYVAIKGGIL